MNPVTFNDKFIRAVAVHPESRRIAKVFGNWQIAPLFDYETTWEKEISLTPQGTAVGEIKVMPWPFETFRLAMTERGVPQDENNPNTLFDTYKTHLVARRRDDGEMHLLIFWRTLGFTTRDADAMLHVYTYTSADGVTRGGCSASIYTPRRGWDQNVTDGSADAVSIMAGSAIASLASFLADAMLPTNQLVEVRPNQPNRSVEWLKARTHFTFITHGHPANDQHVVEFARVKSDNTAELSRMAHNRREHQRTYRHARFTYARGKTITVRATWCGPKEWQDEGGRQIYRILEPVVDS
jgi:hypothetical protein